MCYWYNTSVKQTVAHEEADRCNFPLDHEHITQIQDMLIAWFEANGRDLPWRHTRDPYKILVAEIMLQQTQVDRVKPKYAAFLQQFPTIEALAQASPGNVIRAWAGLGYNRRALNLQRTAQAVLNEHGGQFPDAPDALRTLPGIGPYTAGAIACFAFERDVAFMDTNIRRVITRVFVGADDGGMGERGLLEIASAAVPKGRGWVWNQAIMELGALVCTAAKPRCQLCPLRRECCAYASWCEADQAVFTYAPRRQALAKVAERRIPFTATPRYFRGRIIHVLRQLEAGQWLLLSELGPQVKVDWTSNDEVWLQSLLQDLANDGLVELDKEQRARLP
jgi:A/G-specific adenine glycosylase